MAKMNNNEMEKKLAEYLDERWCIAINSEPERQAIDRSYYNVLVQPLHKSVVGNVTITENIS